MRHYINPMWTYGIFFPFWDCRLNLCNPVNKMSLVVWGVVLNDSCQSSLGTTLKGHLDTPVTDRLDIVWRGLWSSCKKASWGGNEDLKKKDWGNQRQLFQPLISEQMIFLLSYELCVSEANGWMGDGCCRGLTSVTQNRSLVVIRLGQIKTLFFPWIVCHIMGLPSHSS